MKGKITARDILRTLHADLIGKDSHRGITLTYGWMANQVGHFALGFIPVLLLYKKGFSIQISFIAVSMFWLAFEIYNALSPLYKKEYKGNGKFKVQWGNLTFDTFTDLCFFWLGSSSMFFLYGGDHAYIWLYCLLIVALLIFTRYWFLTKFYQQNTYLPYPFRLSQWNNYISEENRDQIMKYWKDPEKTRHFIVYGVKGSGKTRLMVGVANEMAIRHRLSTYTTYSKFVSQLQEANHELDQNTYSRWNWTESDFLVIDDINPGVPDQANKIKAEDLITLIDMKHSERNRTILKKCSVAWIVAANHEHDSDDNWINMLIQLGVPHESIHVIRLKS